MEELDFKEITSILWRKKFIVLAIILIFIIIGAVYSYKIITPDYKASTTLILGRINSSSSDILSQTGKDTNQITQSEIAINSNLVSTYSELIKSKSLTQKVKDNLDIHIEDKEFRKNINVSRISETELIEITVTNRDGKLAADIANEIAKVFSDKIEEIYNISNVYIIDRATETDIPYNINHFKDIVIFIILGIAISLSYVVIYSMIDTTIKSSEDIEKEIGIKNLISIPVRKGNKKENSFNNELITYNDAKSINSEVFKTLRTNVQFSNINNKENKVMLVTSCFSSEGKSYISANLATVFAQAGKKVVLIDADMRRGRQSKIFNLPNELGLSNYLSNLDNNGMEINERINKYINETEIKNLNVITSGNIPPNPSELLTSNKLPELIKELSIFYDLIIFDGAPVLPIADSLILARMANSTILVSLYNKTKKDELLKAKKDIQNVGGRIIGTVLNKVPNSNYEYENKYYYYGKEESTEKRKKYENLKNDKTNLLKEKVKSIFKKIKSKIDEKLKNRLKNKIKLLCAGTNLNILDDDKTVKEYEIELKRLENEKKELAKQEQLKKKKEQEELENERQKAREELVKNKEAEIINQNNERLKEEAKLKEEKQNEIKKIEEAKKQGLEELEKRKQEEKIKKEEIAKKQEENKQKELEEKEKLEEKRKIAEVKKIENQKRREELKENLNKNLEKIKESLNILKLKIKEKKDNFIKIFNEKKAENKIKAEKNKKIKEENRIKQKELKEEKLKAEKEKKARQAEENELIRQKELEEKEKLRLIKEEERKEKNRELENERQIMLEKKLEEKIKKAQAKEEKRKFREEEKQRQKEEERIKEQILEDNLYPKTKYNKDL